MVFHALQSPQPCQSHSPHHPHPAVKVFQTRIQPVLLVEPCRNGLQPARFDRCQNHRDALRYSSAFVCRQISLLVQWQEGHPTHQSWCMWISRTNCCTVAIKSNESTPWPRSIYLHFTLRVAFVSTLRFGLSYSCNFSLIRAGETHKRRWGSVFHCNFSLR